MSNNAQVQEEIGQIRRQMTAITVGRVPIEGYEVEYKELQQQLSVLQELLAAEEPKDKLIDSLEEAPRLGQLLEDANDLTKSNQFAEAFAALDEAEKYVGEHEERLAMVAETRRQVKRTREAWKKAQAQRIKQALEDETQALPTEIETWIEEYWAKAPDDEAQVETWLKSVSGQHIRDRAVQATEALRPELEALWNECQRAITVTEIVAAADAARQALDRVRDLEREYPEAAPVRTLVEEAETWERQARGPATTAAQTANFEHLLEEYEELQKKSHDRLPRFQAVREAGYLVFAPDEKGNEILQLDPNWELVPADIAIREIETLATDYACQKAEEKLELAQQAMPRDPRRAHSLLQEARDLFVPKSHRQDTQWLEWLSQVDDYARITVQPAVTRREEAETRRDAASTTADVLAAWDELSAVEGLDPHTPLLAKARLSLYDRLTLRIKQALEQAQGLRRRRRWQEAQNVVQAFLTRTQQDDGLAGLTHRLDEFIQSCEQDARDEQSILDTLDEIQKLLKQDTLEAVQEAHKRLSVLEPPPGKQDDDPAVGAARERLAAYPQIGRLRDRIDIRLNLQALLDRAKLTHDTATSDEELEAALDALKEALEEHKAHSQIMLLQKRLHARLLFRQAEREYGLSPFADVRKKYQAARDRGGDDADQADQRLEQMSQDEEKAEGVERTLAAAEEHLKQRRYRQARSLLQPLAERRPPVPQSGRVWKFYGRATDGLVDEIEGKLDTLRRRGRRKLDTAAIFETVDELSDLDPERARHWDEVVARCYMQLARESENAKEALRHWEDARDRVVPESRWHAAIAAGVRKAYKRVVFDQVAAFAGNLEEARRLLEELLARYPNDPEIRMRMVDILLRGGDLRAAGMQWESASQLLRQATDDVTTGLSGELVQLRQKLETAEHLQREQERIEARLKPENPLGDFQWAKRKYSRVRRDQDPAHQLALDDWWEALVDRVIGEMEAEWEEEGERGSPPWKAAGPMLKILELRKEHGRARQILREAARASLDLHGKVERSLYQTGGPLGVPPAEALNRQIDEAERLLEEAAAYEEIFKRRRGQLRDLQPTDLDKQVARIRAWRDSLLNLSQRIDEARSILGTAMRTGERRYWELGEELMQQISGTFDRSAPGTEVSRYVRPTGGATFAVHPTVRLLVEDFKSAKVTRARLEGYLEELPKAWQREDFVRVRWLIQELRMSDPNGQRFGLSSRRVQIRVLDRIDIDLDRLEELVNQREEQLEALEGWAEAARQVVPWHMLSTRRFETLPETAGENEAAIETIQALQRAVQSGDFWGAGNLYTSLPPLGSEADPEKAKQPVQPLSRMVQLAIERADFAEALRLSLAALCGSHLPPEITGVLQEEWPDLGRAVEQWNEVRGSQEGELVYIQGYGSGDMWSLIKAKRWLAEPPLKTYGKEHSICRRAGLALAQGMALAHEIDVWETEAQAQLDAVPEIQRRFNSLLETARDNINQADRIHRWWKRGERKRFLEAAQAALDEAGRLCPEDVNRIDLQSLLNAMR